MPIKTKQAIENIIEALKKIKKSTFINCWRKAGIINFRFSFSEITKKKKKQRLIIILKKNE
jgi:hypothetical protein